LITKIVLFGNGIILAADPSILLCSHQNRPHFGSCLSVRSSVCRPVYWLASWCML